MWAEHYINMIWKTFKTLKSETIWEYISKKNDKIEEINSPFTPMYINFDLLLFLDIKNWKIPKNKEDQSKKFPKEGAIN